MTRPASNGSIIGAIQEPSPTSAGGIWTLPAQYELQKEGNWIAPGYNISRSLRFNSADSAYLNRTPASAGNRKTWTWSGWVKRGKISSNNIYAYFFTASAAGSGSNSTNCTFNLSDNSLRFEHYPGSTSINCTTSAVFRDPSAWYHIVFAIDTTQATNSNGVKIYVNGVQQTLSFTAYTQNADTNMNNTTPQGIGLGYASDQYFDGYLADIHFIDGTALTPSSFGETDTDTGVWKPKQYTGSYGTNGFNLKFADNSGTTSTTLGKDSSSNGNNWTPNNFSVTAGAGNDSLVDSPTRYGTDTGAGGEVRGNYATWNSLVVNKPVLTNGNLDADGSDLKTAISTMGVSSGKWYWEISIGSGTNTPNMGVTSYANDKADPGVYLGTGRSYVSGGGGGVYKNYTATSTGANTNFSDGNTAGAVIGFALDCDAGTLAYYVNNVLRQTDSTIATGTLLYPMTCNFNSTTNAYRNTSVNFGQRPFAYTAPSGFKALCTQNLPEPTVTQGDDYFNTVLYTGTSAVQTITGVGFQPDFSWIKIRNAVDSHYLFDAVRGKGATYMKTLYSNATNAESPGNNTSLDVGVTDFASDGFTFGSGALNGNQSPYTFVAWNWKANGSGSSNTAGTITSTVSANTTSGFSIVTYTGNSTVGATVGHGLGVAPKMIIVKSRSGTTNWPVYHESIGNTKAIFLNLTNATDTDTYWNNTSPTSTVFSLNASTGLNSSGSNYVAYCFAPVAGYSAFGSYTGNGSADGPFVHLGFRPAWIMWKRSNTTSDWYIWDAKRSPRNAVALNIWPNQSSAEYDYGADGTQPLDFLSNGFKPRVNSIISNNNGDTYIYAAFASNPFKFSLGA